MHPAHFNLHPALCNILNVIRTLILYVSGNFPKFRTKNSKLSILNENWPTRNLEVLNSNPDVVVWNSDSKAHFWGNLGRKIQSYRFCLKIGTDCIKRMLIFIPTLVFWICSPKSIFGQIWAKKVKVVHFSRKLALRVSRGCWFLFYHYFFEFPTQNLFLGKFAPKKSKLFVLHENQHMGYLEDADSYRDISFLNFRPLNFKSIFGQIWAEKSKLLSLPEN